MKRKGGRKGDSIPKKKLAIIKSGELPDSNLWSTQPQKPYQNQQQARKIQPQKAPKSDDNILESKMSNNARPPTNEKLSIGNKIPTKGIKLKKKRDPDQSHHSTNNSERQNLLLIDGKNSNPKNNNAYKGIGNYSGPKKYIYSKDLGFDSGSGP